MEINAEDGKLDFLANKNGYGVSCWGMKYFRTPLCENLRKSSNLGSSCREIDKRLEDRKKAFLYLKEEEFV